MRKHRGTLATALAIVAIASAACNDSTGGGAGGGSGGGAGGGSGGGAGGGGGGAGGGGGGAGGGSGGGSGGGDGGTAALEAYLKAEVTDEFDVFGISAAISDDGNTLVLGAFGEDSEATTVNGDATDDSGNNNGAAYVFVRNGSSWEQQAYLKASNNDPDPPSPDLFGWVVAISGDGNTIAVGATDEASDETGTEGSGANNDAPFSGAVYVFSRTGETWTETGFIKASNTGEGDEFGCAIALSDDGDTLAVGAFKEYSLATEVGGDQGDGDQDTAGAVYVFVRDDEGWTQQAYVKASNTDGNGDGFGAAVALSADGNTLAVGDPWEDSDATGIDGDDANNDAINAGAVYVYTRTGTSWAFDTYVKASDTTASDFFGRRVALSEDGDTLAVSGYQQGPAVGDLEPGTVYVYTRTGDAWSWQADVRSEERRAYDWFGYSISLSADGNTLAVGEPLQDVVNGPITQIEDVGQVHVFSRAAGSWTVVETLDPAIPTTNESWGYTVSLSADASTLVVTSPYEDSNAVGVGGDQENDLLENSGAAYVFSL